MLSTSFYIYLPNVLFVMHRMRGHWAIYYTSPQSLIRWLNIFGDFYWIYVGMFIKLSVQTFQPLNVMYRRSNFVYHLWRCTSIYRPLSYPFIICVKYQIIHIRLISFKSLKLIKNSLLRVIQGVREGTMDRIFNF